VLSGNFTNHGGAIFNAGTLTINDSILTGNVSLDGGAIFNEGGSAIVNVNRSSISNNTAQNSGGGIMNRYGDVNVVDSTLSGNAADIDSESGSGRGGGLSSYESGAAVSVTGSTISGNSAFLYGGGIYQASGTLTITSSTISGNSATDRGGGLYARYMSSGAVTINHSTIAFNTTPGSGSSGAGIRSSNRAILNHTIVSNNLRGASPDDVSGTFTANFSLIGNAGSSSITNTSSIVGTTQANLAPLADNGGRARTHALLSGSVAIDAGNAAIVGAPSFDQRGTGFPRIIDGDNNAAAVIDIGAFERALPATLVVDIATDENDFIYAAGDLSLREALILANGTPGVADTISFHASLSGSTVNLTLGTLTVTDAVTINGLGADLLTINASGNGGNRIFNIDDGSAGTAIVVALAGLTLTGGNVTGDGGAIRNTENLSLTRMSISGNTATAIGGGVKNEQGTLTIVDSTFSANSAATGGAIWTDTNLTTQTATIVGSTISGNSASASGGGIFNADGLTVIRHSTVTNNTATVAGGGLGSAANATTRTEVQSTIVAANVNSDVAFVTGATNSFQSNGYNIVGSGNANVEFVEAGDRRNISNPLLGALANNGGPTLTHLLMALSPALNAGGIALPGSGGVPMFDQRGSGFSRVLGSQLDIGAIEMPAPTGPELPGDYNRDGSVDAADYVMWRKTLSMTVPQYEGADGDGDTTIGNGDYSVWAESFGESTSGSGGGGISESLVETGDVDTHNRRAVLDASTAPAREFAMAAVRGTPAAPGSAPIAKTSNLLNVLDSLFSESDDQYGDSDSLSTDESESSAQDEVFDQIGDGSALEMLSI
jgi:hypothetical protein